MDKTCQYMFKIIIIGDSGVGKTCLMTRFTDECFQAVSPSTIGVDFKIKGIEIDGLKVKLQIWDTAGQERFKAIVSSYYRGVSGIFIVFDVMNKKSFENIREWFKEIEKKGATDTAEIMILGNKVDEIEDLEATKEMVNKFLEEKRIPPENFIEVSAKDDINVEKSFLSMARKLIEKKGAINKRLSSKSKLMLNNTQRRRNCC